MARCHARAFAGGRRAWSAKEFATLLESAHVCAVGDETAFALARVVAQESELLTIATDPGFRRQGRARRALSAIEAEAARRGARKLFLEVAADNEPAAALYRSAGYRQIARRADYYKTPGGAVDALILEKPLEV